MFLKSGFLHPLFLGFGLLLVGGALLTRLSYRPLVGVGVQQILSDSMAPNLHSKDLIFYKRSSNDQYKVGEIISYRMVLPQTGMTHITHRIAREVVNGDVRWYQTKGDANSGYDSWLVPTGAVQGKVVMRLPWLGNFLSVMRTKPGFLFFALFFFLAAVVQELRWIRNVWGKKSYFPNVPI